MNIPAIAKSTYEKLKSNSEFSKITEIVYTHLKKINNRLERARFVHNVIEEYNRDVLAHPMVKEFMPCKAGCSACCHTQVSVTEDEAHLLLHALENGVKIDLKKLARQSFAQDSSADFYKLSYQDRGCVFLDEKGTCQVYKDRPSVCRTNIVLGESSQCLNENKPSQSLRLVKTERADMAIVASYVASSRNGALPYMLSRLILEQEKTTKNESLKKISQKLQGLKAVFKDKELM